MRTIERSKEHLDPAQMDWPPVSVVLSVCDGEDRLPGAVSHILDQDYPGRFELVIALAPSRDHTGQVARDLAATDARVRLVPNPNGGTARGLNAAVTAARFGLIARLDESARPGRGYLRRAVWELEETGAGFAGGPLVPEGTTPLAAAVAHTLTGRIGLGDTREGPSIEAGAGPVETVGMGVYRRHTHDQLGGYNETFLQLADWEFHRRIREVGGTVWSTPDLRAPTRTCGSLGALARESYRGGRWRHAAGRRHPGTYRLRHLAAPVALAAALVSIAVGVAGLVAELPGAAIAGLGVPVLCLLGVVVGSLTTGSGLAGRSRLWRPLVVVTMQVSWGAGFLAGPPVPGRDPVLLRPLRNPERPRHRFPLTKSPTRP